MRLPRVRFTLRRMVAVIAGCALYFAVLREAPWFVVVFHLLVFPVIGSLFEIRKGGKGLIGGLIGGAIGSLSVALGLGVLAYTYGDLPHLDLVYSLCVALDVTMFGGILGGFVGILVWYVATILKIVLRREEKVGVLPIRPG